MKIGQYYLSAACVLFLVAFSNAPEMQAHGSVTVTDCSFSYEWYERNEYFREFDDEDAGEWQLESSEYWESGSTEPSCTSYTVTEGSFSVTLNSFWGESTDSFEEWGIQRGWTESSGSSYGYYTYITLDSPVLVEYSFLGVMNRTVLQPGDYGLGDFNIDKTTYGNGASAVIYITIPEPSSFLAGAFTGVVLFIRRRRMAS